MALWTIGDLHLSFASGKPMDVFGDKWKDHDEKIKDFWLSNVSQDDVVVLVGDTSWAIDFDELLPDLLFLHELPGTKILVKGNHDYWWQTVKKMNELLTQHQVDDILFLQNNHYVYDDVAICGSRGWMMEGESAPKMIRRECMRLEMSLQSAPQALEKIVFLHYPPILEEDCCQPMIEIMQKYGVKKCFYGHLHAGSVKKAVQGEHFGINFSLVSADSLDFCMQNILK